LENRKKRKPPVRNASGVSLKTCRWVLFATVLASSMAFINQSALNVALPVKSGVFVKDLKLKSGVLRVEFRPLKRQAEKY
jgi:hypothetical protein